MQGGMMGTSRDKRTDKTTSASTNSSESPFLRLPPQRQFKIRKPLLYLGASAVVILIATGLLGEGGLRTYLDLRQEQRKLEAEVRELELRESTLQTNLDALANDPEALEKVAREKYRMLLEGEKIIEVVAEQEER
jgi:cell division protein FtsB